MRTLLLTLSIASGIAGATISHHSSLMTVAAATIAPSLEAQQPQPSQPPQINVEVKRDGRVWYANPVWIAIGALAVLVVILLIVMAARGGGTTVVRG